MRPFSLRVAIVVLGAAVLTALAAPAMARADAVTQWNANANAAILASNPTAHSSVLSSAMVQGAVYDAVNGIVGGYKPYLVRPAVNPWDSTDAAVATAAYRVLLSVVPASQTAALATLAAQYTAALAAGPQAPRRTAASQPAKQPQLRCSRHARTTAAIRPRRSRSSSAPRPACGGCPRR